MNRKGHLGFFQLPLLYLGGERRCKNNMSRAFILTSTFFINRILKKNFKQPVLHLPQELKLESTLMQPIQRLREEDVTRRGRKRNPRMPADC